MSEPKRVGIWIRVSTDMQAESDSPEHHEQRAKYYIQAHDWELVTIYHLEAMSGKSVMDYPETKRMLADIRRGHISGLVFSKLARLARNTKELLDFSEIFRAHNADLISLQESIDTSSPAGRLFYTMIAAMAQWEREEISSRVAASVPIRAKLGKPLGGAAPFGYQWAGKEFVVDPKEAPIRKLMYELFLQHQRKSLVAQELHRKGFRTRNGSLFTGTTIERLLRDGSAKGERRANYTKSPGKNKNWSVKPESEWIIVPCEAVVSTELWNQVNGIMDAQEKRRVKVGPKPVYLLSGLVKCQCGKVMYVYQQSKNYVCAKCKTRIAVADIDEIYQLYLREYLSSISMAQYIEQSDAQLQEAKALLAVSKAERDKVAKRVDALINLRLEGDLSKERYAEQYQPLEQRLQQLDGLLPELEAEIDVRTISLLSTDVVLHEARTLHDEWETLPFSQKQSIVETITTEIIIYTADITITLAYAPRIPVKAENNAHHSMGSYSLPT